MTIKLFYPLETKICYIVTLLVFVSLNLHSQSNTNIDSLKSLISETHGKVRYEAQYLVAFELFDINNIEAESYAHKAHSLALQLGDSLMITKSGRLWGQLLRRINKPEMAIEQLKLILPIARRNKIIIEEKLILNAIAVTYTLIANYDAALEYHFLSLELLGKEGDQKQLAIAFNNIGLVYYKLNNFERALFYYNRSKETKEKSKVTFDLDILYINISLCYIKIKNYDEAKIFVLKAFQFCNKNCNDFLLTEGEFCLGLISFERQDYKKAKEYFLSALYHAQSAFDQRYESEIYFYLGKLEFANGEHKNANTNLMTAVDVAIKAGNNEVLIGVYEELSKLHSERKNLKLAFKFQSEYIKLKDSIYNRDLIKNLANLQSSFEERANLQIIQEKEKALVLQNEIIGRQHLQTILVAIISGLFLFIIILLYSNYRKKVRFEVILEDRVKSRTAELENSRFALEKQNFEQLNIIQQTSIKNKSLLATLHGSFNLATHELKDPIAVNYFLSIRKMVGQLEESFKTLHHNLARTDKSPQK